MNTENSIEAYTIYENGWINRIRPPAKAVSPEKVLLLLHGWTGDESSMWVFTPDILDEYWLIALRGPVKAPSSGYSWFNLIPGRWPLLSEIRDAVDEVFSHLTYLYKYLNISPAELGVIGFSQGGAMAYACALLHPQQVQKAAILSGFMPRVDTNKLRLDLIRKNKFLITHGLQDEIIPVEKAREAVGFLRGLGMSPQYCEEETGHRLSPTCYKAVQKFYS